VTLLNHYTASILQGVAAAHTGGLPSSHSMAAAWIRPNTTNYTWRV
jgi:hypothetical protein